jgi:hypothetical protein
LEFLMDGLRKAGLQVPPQEQQEMR